VFVQCNSLGGVLRLGKNRKFNESSHPAELRIDRSHGRGQLSRAGLKPGGVADFSDGSQQILPANKVESAGNAGTRHVCAPLALP
jgi:hypothetical protein